MEVFRQNVLRKFNKDKKMKSLLFFFLFSVAYGQTDLTKYLPKGYNKTGEVDYTDYLQKGLNENVNVQFPDFPVLINVKGLNVRSNQVLNFSKNSKLMMKPNSEEMFGILNIKFAENVTVNNPNLVGDKDKHLGTKGEWGMGINIMASKNVTINNPIISKTWGDGIYIGEPTEAEKKTKKLKSYENQNITINKGVIDDCLRNGISVISGINVLIDGTTIQNINSKAPKAAIDVEPNNKNNKIKNIKLCNITTKNNFNGIVVFLVKLVQERKYDIGEILIENHRDYNSKGALTIRIYSEKDHKDKIYQAINGIIRIKDNSYFGTTNVYSHNKDIKYNPKIEFSNIKYYKQVGDKYLLDTNAINLLKSRIKIDPQVKIVQ